MFLERLAGADALASYVYRKEIMKPLLSYYGGKQRLVSKILPYIEAIPHTLYAEPFCGGAALLFAKPKRIVTNTDFYREAINDINKLVTNFYRVAIKNPKA